MSLQLLFSVNLFVALVKEKYTEQTSPALRKPLMPDCVFNTCSAIELEDFDKF